MNKQHSRARVARAILLCWCLFIGLGAVFGGSCMLLKPDGSLLSMQGMLPYFQVLPFADVLFCDYTLSGCALLAVNGVTNLTAAALLIADKRAGRVLGGVFGVTLMLWICIQFVIFPANPLSISYFIFGLLQAVTGYAAWVFDRQESFSVKMEDYPNIGSNPKELVVFFSRLGYTKKLACERADKTGAVLLELESTERTDGTIGFWWCGRYAMHRWPMPIKPADDGLEKFDRVTICTPIWAFALCGPVRAFCESAAGKISRVDYILVHHQKTRSESVTAEMDGLLGVRHESLESVCCRKGRYIVRK